MELIRCGWADPSHLGYIRYHDEEWGVPVHNDFVHFEFLILEGAQAGLSWKTILNKREGYRKAFAHFDPARVARFGPSDVERLLKDPGIVRNRLKVASAISNAEAFLRVEAEYGSFDAYIWAFTGGKPVVNHWTKISEIPARTALSDTISRDLIRRGFRFVGSTIVYAHLQACGLVNDHLVTCFRYDEINKSYA
jgi:DNA-3-methyladenine glycosylase I